MPPEIIGMIIIISAVSASWVPKKVGGGGGEGVACGTRLNTGFQGAGLHMAENNKITHTHTHTHTHSEHLQAAPP